MIIKDYGWNEHFESAWNERINHTGKLTSEQCRVQPGRVISDYGQMLRVVTESGEIFVNRPMNNSQLAVGDWVALEYSDVNKTTQVNFVLPRKTKFSRAAAGIEVKEQIVAANVDTVFLIQSLNKDFNMRRLERYLIAAWDSGAVPIVVLTKADCCENVPEKVATVNATALGVEVLVVSCLTGEGVEEIKKHFSVGKTIALLGSSGVGKSTLVNTLAGKELLKTQGIREDDSKGRHTTTHRELLLLPDGGLILDTPGMRSLSLWEADAGMEAMFGDVEELTKLCRFTNCKHQTEPGCAVREAIESGNLEMTRWESWTKLQKEIAFLEAKKEGKQRLLERQFGKKIAKYQKDLKMR